MVGYLDSIEVTDKEHVEWQGKRGDEQDRQKHQPHKSEADIEQHTDGNSGERQIFQHKDEIEPGQEEGKCSNLPLPGWSTPTLVAVSRHKDD